MALQLINQPLEDGYYVVLKQTLGASQVLPYGSLAVSVSGVIKTAQPATANQLVLGASLQPLAETTAADFTLSEPASFARGFNAEFFNSTTDPVADADVGALVAFADGSTVKRTVAMNDVTAQLVAVRPDGTVQVRL